MIEIGSIKVTHWNNINSKLIGLGKPYSTIRILLFDILSIQKDIDNANKEIKRLTYNNYYDQSSKGIEELGLKTCISILSVKLEDAYYSLNKFKSVSEQIPKLCGQVNCILDYIIHGVRWINIEIRTNTIAQRMNEENCIAYVNEANKLIGGIRYHYEYRTSKTST